MSCRGIPILDEKFCFNTRDIPQLIKWATENLKGFGVEQISFDVAIEDGHRVAFAIKQAPDVVSVKSVPLEEVDDWLKQGYKVRELYAKTATIVKLEVQQP